MTDFEKSKTEQHQDQNAKAKTGDEVGAGWSSTSRFMMTGYSGPEVITDVRVEFSFWLCIEEDLLV